MYKLEKIIKVYFFDTFKEALEYVETRTLTNFNLTCIEVGGEKVIRLEEIEGEV